MPYGIVATGWNSKPLQTIKAELEAAERAVFGNQIDTSATSVLGELNALISDRLAELWQLGQASYTGVFPDGASGLALDLLCAITGVARKPATYTEVQVTLTGVGGTVIPGGSQVSVAGVGTKFQTLGGTIGGGGTVTLTFQALTTGPVVAPAGTLTVIETPVSGWVSATNALDQSILGTDIETDQALRLRREQSLRALGGASLDAIRAGIFEVPNVTSAEVFENNSDSTDGSGLPPHSFEAVVYGGTDQAVREKIFERKAAGVATFGNVTGTVTDGSGDTHTVNFSRPVVLDVYVKLTVYVSAGAPANLADLIKQAIAAYGDLNYRVGSDVIAHALIPTVFGVSPTIKNCSEVLIGTIGAGFPTTQPVSSTTIAATNHEIATMDTSRIDVTVLPI